METLPPADYAPCAAGRLFVLLPKLQAETTRPNQMATLFPFGLTAQVANPRNHLAAISYNTFALTSLQKWNNVPPSLSIYSVQAAQSLLCKPSAFTSFPRWNKGSGSGRCQIK
jgi:hypothetical protein